MSTVQTNYGNISDGPDRETWERELDKIIARINNAIDEAAAHTQPVKHSWQTTASVNGPASNLKQEVEQFANKLKGCFNED